MSENGAAARAQLAATAKAAGTGRASALRSGPSFAALCQPPAWATGDADQRAHLGGLAALLQSAPSLRRCVDGKILGPLADAFGDDALEAALQTGGGITEGDAGSTAEQVPADALSPDAMVKSGADILRRAAAGDGASVRLLQTASSLPAQDAERVDAA